MAARRVVDELVDTPKELKEPTDKVVVYKVVVAMGMVAVVVQVVVVVVVVGASQARPPFSSSWGGHKYCPSFSNPYWFHFWQ